MRVAEERDAVEEESVGDALEEWREAERDAEAEDPDSSASKMARKRADAARDEYHEAEDEAWERAGDHRPRHADPLDGDS
jgi:hypothetical protein